VVEGQGQGTQHDVLLGGHGILARLDEGHVVDLVGQTAPTAQAGAEELELLVVLEVGQDLVVEDVAAVVTGEPTLQPADGVGVDDQGDGPEQGGFRGLVAEEFQPVGGVGAH